LYILCHYVSLFPYCGDFGCGTNVCPVALGFNVGVAGNIVIGGGVAPLSIDAPEILPLEVGAVLVNGSVFLSTLLGGNTLEFTGAVVE
jgi:hypothetical protein